MITESLRSIGGVVRRRFADCPEQPSALRAPRPPPALVTEMAAGRSNCTENATAGQVFSSYLRAEVVASHASRSRSEKFADGSERREGREREASGNGIFTYVESRAGVSVATSCTAGSAGTVLITGRCSGCFGAASPLSIASRLRRGTKNLAVTGSAEGGPVHFRWCQHTNL